MVSAAARVKFGVAGTRVTRRSPAIYVATRPGSSGGGFGAAPARNKSTMPAGAERRRGGNRGTLVSDVHGGAGSAGVAGEITSEPEPRFHPSGAPLVCRGSGRSLGDELVPGGDPGAGGPGVVFGGEALHHIGLRGDEVVGFDPVGR